jgi:hypothetical protein
VLRRVQSVELGISVGAHHYAGEDDLRELPAKADAAIYQAKLSPTPYKLAVVHAAAATERAMSAAYSGSTNVSDLLW